MEARLTVYFKYPFGVGVFEGIEDGKHIFVGTAQPDGSIFLESLYAKTEYNDDNYQRFIDYVANETSVDRERFISSFEIVSD
jgi:hypothetical protein